jgi:hypothetical protein
LITNDHPSVELHNAPTHRINNPAIVCCHYDRRARAVDPVEQPHNALTSAGVKVSGWFVSHENERAIHERPRDRHTLLLATG